jgi:hypothetical protein
MRQHFKVTHSHALNDEEIPSLNKIVEKVNGNMSMKEFIILKTTKQMIDLMITKTMIAGRNTINL